MRTIYSSWLLDELVTGFGEGAVDRIVAAYATERIAIPVKPSAKMIADLGEEVSLWLCEQKGGQFVSVPSANHVRTKRRMAARDRDIQQSSEPISVLAKRYDLSHRRIFSIKAQAAPNF